jgi:molybdopterin-guanine dinucleotide biosynthesis protein A
VDLRGRTLLARTLDAVMQVAGLAEVVLVLAPEQDVPSVECDVTLLIARDRIEGEGPLVGIAAGLAMARSPVCLILGCDTPFVRPPLLDLLATAARDHATVMPVHEDRPQPLCSAIRRDELATVEALLAAGKRGPSALADDPRTLVLAPSEWERADPEGISFIGVNTPEELATAERLAAHIDG